MIEQNQQPAQLGGYPPTVPASYQQNDEIDLRELFLALWQGKVTIIITTVLFAVVAVAYALTAQQWWASKAKIAVPQLQDMALYMQQVNQYESVLGNKPELTALLQAETLFGYFLENYSSNDNKRRFLESSSEFREYRSQLGLDGESGESAQDTMQRLYREWFDKMTANAEDKKNPTLPYNLSLQSTTKNSSYLMLNGYIQFIANKARDNAWDNLQVVVDSSIKQLQNQKLSLVAQARSQLEVEIQRTQYALDIAKAASVNKPIENFNNKEIFSIDMGTQALAAKIKALQSVKNLSVIQPGLQSIDAKLEMLQAIKIDREEQFQTYRMLEDVEAPISRDKPKRALIAVLGTLLGGMLGVAIVLIRFAFRKESK